MTLTSSPSPKRRTVDRIRALSKADLPAPLVVNLQVSAIAQALRAAGRPAFFVLESRDVPQADFTVWLGSEMITGEIRMLLGAGFWPGPEDVPSPSKLIRDPQLDRFVCVTLYGTDADGPWSPLWRQRHIRHGLYGVFRSPQGRIGVMLTHRAEDPPFTPTDAAFVKDCSPYVEQALDRAVSESAGPSAPVETVHIRFTVEGKIAALSLSGAEMLRDLGGGGPGAGTIGREMVEKAVSCLRVAPSMEASERASLTLAGGAEERAFRETRADILISRAGQVPDRRSQPVTLGQNRVGRYEFWPSVMVELTGEPEVAASLTRFVPTFAMRLHGAVQADASAREIQLLCALESAGTLKAAAESMGIREETARTLGKRLALRVEESGLAATALRLEAIGRAHWP